MNDRQQINLRVPEALIAGIDERLAIVNAGRDKKVSRNDWFVSMAGWVVDSLPHQAVRSDLIDAWADIPDDTLGIEARHWHRRDDLVNKAPDGSKTWRCSCGREWTT